MMNIFKVKPSYEKIYNKPFACLVHWLKSVASVCWNVNFPDYTHCCYIIWLGASSFIVTLEKSNTYTQFTMNMYGTRVPDFPELKVYCARARPESHDTHNYGKSVLSRKFKF